MSETPPPGAAQTDDAPDAPDAPAAATAGPGAVRPAFPGAIRRSDSSRCRTPGCTKYHDFFQWNGKYYCLECYEALRTATRGATAAH